jgi:hypothetical protein
MTARTSPNSRTRRMRRSSPTGGRTGDPHGQDVAAGILEPDPSEAIGRGNPSLVGLQPRASRKRSTQSKTSRSLGLDAASAI